MKRKAKQYVLIYGAVVIALLMVSSATAVNVLKTNEPTENSLERELQDNNNNIVTRKDIEDNNQASIKQIDPEKQRCEETQSSDTPILGYGLVRVRVYNDDFIFGRTYMSGVKVRVYKNNQLVRRGRTGLFGRCRFILEEGTYDFEGEVTYNDFLKLERNYYYGKMENVQISPPDTVMLELDYKGWPDPVTKQSSSQQITQNSQSNTLITNNLQSNPILQNVQIQENQQSNEAQQLQTSSTSAISQSEQKMYDYMSTTKIGEVKQAVYESSRANPKGNSDIMDSVDAFFDVLPEIGVTEDMTVLEADQIIEDNWDTIEASVEGAGLINRNRRCSVSVGAAAFSNSWCFPPLRIGLALQCRWEIDNYISCYAEIDGVEGLQKSDDKDQSGRFLLFCGSSRSNLAGLGNVHIGGFTWISISDVPFENGGNNNQQSNQNSQSTLQGNPQSNPSSNLQSSPSGQQNSQIQGQSSPSGNQQGPTSR